MVVRVDFALGEGGAAEAGARGDVVVIVDALRASVTAAAALDVGMRRVVPIAQVGEARRWLGQPGIYVAGERDGAKVAGFHFGNSPTTMLTRADELRGQTLVLTTTNGTRCIAAAARHDPPAVYVGSLPNATPLARLAYDTAWQAGANITLVACGVFDAAVEEDDWAVSWLGRLLAGYGAAVASFAEPPLVAALPQRFAASDDGQKLSALGYADDVAFCARLDALSAVPVYRAGELVAASTLMVK